MKFPNLLSFLRWEILFLYKTSHFLTLSPTKHWTSSNLPSWKTQPLWNAIFIFSHVSSWNLSLLVERCFIWCFSEYITAYLKLAAGIRIRISLYFVNEKRKCFIFNIRPVFIAFFCILPKKNTKIQTKYFICLWWVKIWNICWAMLNAGG